MIRGNSEVHSYTELITRAERAAIQKEQNKQSRRIKKQKNDGNRK